MKDFLKAIFYIAIGLVSIIATASLLGFIIAAVISSTSYWLGIMQKIIGG